MQVIKNPTDEYKKLPKDKQMYVFGYMQGVLSSQQDKNNDKQLVEV